jgi:hypothetical protein
MTNVAIAVLAILAGAIIWVRAEPMARGQLFFSGGWSPEHRRRWHYFRKMEYKTRIVIGQLLAVALVVAGFAMLAELGFRSR